MLRLEGVRKRYGATEVLRGVSLNVARGERLALCGPSGCGKSTLLRTILGLVAPDAGEIELDGVPIDPRNIERIRLRIGTVVQEGGLFPHLSARDNVLLVARHLGRDDATSATRVETLRELVRLEPAMLDRYPSQLSGGQRQRVGLMRALMLEPDVLLLDEPFTGLDPVVRYDLVRELRDIVVAGGQTMLLVEHDLFAARALCDRIVLLDRGELVDEGTYDSLRASSRDETRRFFAAHGAT